MKTAIKTSLWEDEQYHKLGQNSRLLFIFLITYPNKDQHIYKINNRITSVYTGLTLEQIETSINEIAISKLLDIFDGYVNLYTCRFLVTNKGRYTKNRTNIKLKNVPDYILNHFNQPINRKLIEHIEDTRKGLTDSLKDKVYEAGDYKCKHCYIEDNLSIDHITPVSKWGTNNLDNLQILCVSCNSSKGA